MKKTSFFYGKKYFTATEYFETLFGEKVGKLALDGGFSCPNRKPDGSGGCIYCSSSGTGEFTRGGSIPEQIRLQKEVWRRKGVNRFLAYFQNYTNTYAPLPLLKKRYETALEQEGILGLVIATRADCLPEEVLDYLEALSKRTYVLVELGLQSIHEKSLEFCNRGYSHQVFDQKLQELKERGIRFSLHLIFGLPGERREQMEQSLNYAVSQKPDAIKFHHLYIAKDSPLAKRYEERPFPLFSRENYLNFLMDLLEGVPQEISIHRICSDPDRKTLLAPKWSLNKKGVLADFDRMWKERGTYQGIYYEALESDEG